MLPITDPVLVFALVALLIVLAPVLMERYRLPGMIGLLLAGAILGPHAAGVLDRDASFVLFGTVGLLYLMFGAALEIDPASLKRHGVASAVFGLFTFGLPFGLGLAAARYGLEFSWPAALLVGAIAASHTLVAYPIASRLGLARNRVITTAVGGTFLSEPLALFFLAIVTSAPDGNFREMVVVRMALVLLAYGTAVMIGLPRLARWFLRRVAQDGVSEFAFVLAAIFTCASLGRLLGIEPVIGVFIAGLALNRLIPQQSALMARLRFTGEAIFVPFFLLSVGMLLDVRGLAHDGRSWIVALAIVASTFIGKWLAATAARLLLRFNRDEGQVLFGMGLPHAAGTLAVTIVGVRLKLLTPQTVDGVIVLILLTCIAGPWIVDRFARRLAIASEAPEPTPAAPSQRIVVALSNPASAPPLLELATLLRDEALAQPIFPLSIVPDGDAEPKHVAEAEKMVSSAVAQLAEREIPATPLTRIAPSVAAAISRVRREVQASDVVVGFSSRIAAQEFFFGSVLQRLLKQTDCTLLVSRLVAPMTGSRAMVLIVPPHAERDPAFLPAMGRVGTLARRLGVGVELVSTRDELPKIHERLKHGPFEPKALHPVDFDKLEKGLSSVVGPGDLLALYGARPFSLAWNGSLDKLPRRLARRFSQANLVVVYPGEVAASEEATTPEGAPLSSAPATDTGAFGVD